MKPNFKQILTFAVFFASVNCAEHSHETGLAKGAENESLERHQQVSTDQVTEAERQQRERNRAEEAKSRDIVKHARRASDQIIKNLTLRDEVESLWAKKMEAALAESKCAAGWQPIAARLDQARIELANANNLGYDQLMNLREQLALAADSQERERLANQFCDQAVANYQAIISCRDQVIPDLDELHRRAVEIEAEVAQRRHEVEERRRVAELQRQQRNQLIDDEVTEMTAQLAVLERRMRQLAGIGAETHQPHQQQSTSVREERAAEVSVEPLNDSFTERTAEPLEGPFVDELIAEPREENHVVLNDLNAINDIERLERRVHDDAFPIATAEATEDEYYDSSHTEGTT